MEPLLYLLISILFAFIPASMARKKGYSYGGFWVFGFFLWLPAVIVAACLTDKTKQTFVNPPPPPYGYTVQPPGTASQTPPPPYISSTPQPLSPKPQAPAHITCAYCGTKSSPGKTLCDSCGARL